MINEKEYFYLRRQHETVFAEKWALYSAETQECEILDEEPADDRQPERDAQRTLENAIHSKNESKAKATYTQCLPQHTRALHMRVAVVLARAKAEAKTAQSPAKQADNNGSARMSDLLKQSTALKTQYLRQSSQAVTLVGRIQRDAAWAFANTRQNLGRLQAAQEKLQSELNTFDHGFLVTDANDIKRNVAPEVLTQQRENFLAKRHLVDSGQSWAHW